MTVVAGVLELRGGTAGLKEHKTSLLASRGFVTLTLVYITSGISSNSGKLPPVMELDYFEEAAEWLSKHPMVLPGGIGLHGNCLGSWLVLMLASFRSDLIKATVVVFPTSLISYTSYKYKGKISENFPVDESKLIHMEDGVVLRYALPTDNDDNGTDSTFSAIPPYQNISCPLLMIIGTGDLTMNVDFTARQVYERMKKNDKGHMCTILRYPGAGHIIEPPYTPHCYASFDPFSRDSCYNPYMVWGGEMEAHAQAQEDAWPKVLDFLRKNISFTE